MNPVEIRLAKDRTRIEIAWSDGIVSRIAAPLLRANCRSSDAVRERLQGGMPTESQSVTITKMKSVGSYAVNLGFSDGEERGIYPWPLLRSLGA
jgi:DUF971 family protein